MDRVIHQMVPVRETVASLKTLDDFALTDARGRKGSKLLRSAKRLFKKSGVRINEKIVRIRYDTVNAGSLLEALSLSKRDVALIWGERCDTVLIGPDVLRQLGRETAAFPFAFNNDVTIQIASGDTRDVRVFGLRFVFCPWVSGWCLLPKEATEQR